MARPAPPRSAAAEKSVVCKSHLRFGWWAKHSCSADSINQSESQGLELPPVDSALGGYSDFVWVDPNRLVAKKGEGEWMQFHGWPEAGTHWTGPPTRDQPRPEP